MRSLLLRWGVVLGFLAVPFTGAFAAADADLLQEAHARTTQLVALLKDPYAEEYPAARGMQIFHEKPTGMDVVVTVLTIESFGQGNNHTQFLAVFATLGETFDDRPNGLSLLDVMAIGGKGWRSIDFKSIKVGKEKGQITVRVPTMEYAPNDPMCCPSVKSAAVFAIDHQVGGRLVEMKKEEVRK